MVFSLSLSVSSLSPFPSPGVSYICIRIPFYFYFSNTKHLLYFTTFLGPAGIRNRLERTSHAASYYARRRRASVLVLSDSFSGNTTRESTSRNRRRNTPETNKTRNVPELPVDPPPCIAGYHHSVINTAAAIRVEQRALYEPRCRITRAREYTARHTPAGQSGRRASDAVCTQMRRGTSFARTRYRITLGGVGRLVAAVGGAGTQRLHVLQ